MRNRQDILQEINTEADKHSELKDLQANTSKVSFWKAIKYVVAFAILTLEMSFNKHLNEVKTLITRTEPGTDNWYKELALKYQDGDTIVVQDNLTVYPQKDEKKRLIKRVSITDKPTGGFKIKVAKIGDDGLMALSDDERIRFSIYMSRMKFVGVPIEIISLPADFLNITATIELDSLLFKSDGKTIVDGKEPIKEAISRYLQGFPFDEKFYLSKLIDAVQAVEGVKDIDISRSLLNDVAFDRKIDEVPSGYLNLNQQSKLTYVLN